MQLFQVPIPEPLEPSPPPAASVPAGQERFCQRCDQSVLGVTLRRCPECGRAFDPDAPSTTSPFPRQPIGLVIAAHLRRVNRAWGVAFALMFVVCFAALLDSLWLMMICTLALPFALITVALSAMPFVRLTWGHRLAGLLLPIAVIATGLSYWPFFLSFQLHRPLFERAADRVALNGPHDGGFVGIIHYREVAVRDGTNIGFQITGWVGTGYYVVRADPSQPVIWLNTNSDLPLGGNWHLVWED